MKHNIEKKTTKKNLTSQRTGWRSTILSRHQSKSPVRSRLSVPVVRKMGQRKVREVKVTKQGGPLYNTSWRDHQTPIWQKVPLPSHRTDGTPLLTTLQNKLMHDGRKGVAEKVFWKTLAELNRYSKDGSGYALFYTALDRLKPALITVVRRVGRNYYNVPVPIQGPRQYKTAFQWLLEAARKNSHGPLYRRLAEEVLATTSSPQSEALKKKEAMYRSVVTNRAYAHYRWI